MIDDVQLALDTLLVKDPEGRCAPTALTLCLKALGLKVPHVHLALRLTAMGAVNERKKYNGRQPMWVGVRLREGAMERIIRAQAEAHGAG